MARVLISGYYGFNNLGDEAILAGIIEGFRELNPDMELAVLSQSPGETSVKYGVRALPRNDFRRVLGAIKDCQLFISGGGSLLQDVTGWKSIPYYLGLIKTAQLLGKKTVIFGQGMGPIKSSFNRFLTGKVLAKTDLITVRDRVSRKLLEQLGIDRNQIHLTVDPAFALNPTGDRETEAKKQPPTIGIAPRPWSDNGYLKEMAAALVQFKQETGVRLVLIPMYPAEDFQVITTLKEELEQRGAEARVLNPSPHPRQALEQFAGFDLMVGVRLHSLILAVLRGVPPVGISYDPKIDGFLERLGAKPACGVKDCRADRLLAGLYQTFDKREQIARDLIQKARNFSREALNNTQMVLDLLQ